EGDRLRLCADEAPRPRPPRFESSPDADSKRANVVLRRAPAEPGVVPLFNGRDLAGWKYHPTQLGDWTVEGGVLVGRGRKSHLFTDRGDFADFHLRFEAKVNQDGDGAVFLRTPFFLKSVAVPPGIVAEVPYGYEVQINARTGTLIVDDPVKGVYGRAAGVPPDTWFTGEVVATGNRIRVLINGEVTADFADPKPTYPRGHLALQTLGAPSVVHVRRIEIKELPPGPAAEPDRRADAERLQGTWRVVACEADGEKFHGQTFFPSQMNVRLTFAGRNAHYKWQLPGHLQKYKDELKSEFEGEFRLDEQADPRRISLFVPNDPTNSMLGIYRLEGDRLTVRWRS